MNEPEASDLPADAVAEKVGRNRLADLRDQLEGLNEPLVGLHDEAALVMNDESLDSGLRSKAERIAKASESLNAEMISAWEAADDAIAAAGATPA